VGNCSVGELKGIEQSLAPKTDKGINVMPKKICKWYPLCPIKRFYEEGKLGKTWVEKYCWDSNEKCVRYQLEERGEPHPDNLLPNGEVRKELK
jgi:hypothetical protein